MGDPKGTNTNPLKDHSFRGTFPNFNSNWVAAQNNILVNLKFYWLPVFHLRQLSALLNKVNFGRTVNPTIRGFFDFGFHGLLERRECE